MSGGYLASVAHKRTGLGLGKGAVSPQAKVFLIAQNRLLLEALSRILQKKSEYSIVQATAYSPQVIHQIIESQCNVLLIDSSVIETSDLQLVRDALRAVPGLKVVTIGMEDSEESFFQAVGAGVAGYVLKEASAMDVVAAIRSVLQDEAVCPPRLNLSLFKYVARSAVGFPSVRLKFQLGLTRRQQQLVPLLAQGLTNKEIAAQLNLSEQTIKNHIHRMLQKVGAEDRLSVVEMVRFNQVFM